MSKVYEVVFSYQDSEGFYVKADSKEEALDLADKLYMLDKIQPTFTEGDVTTNIDDVYEASETEARQLAGDIYINEELS